MAHLKTTFFLKSGDRVVVRLKEYSFSRSNLSWVGARGSDIKMKFLDPEQVVAVTHVKKMF